MWYSRKIARVVGSTLASETYALSGSVDLLSWLRIHWAWICQPSSAWKDPETCLSQSPEAYAVVDCKSLYDLIQKTTIPQCQEHRVMLEALIIKDRLKEGVVVKWVHSAAQLADSLTKHMDCSNLRKFLQTGRCIIHDVDEILRARADKRSKKAWVEQEQIPPWGRSIPHSNIPNTGFDWTVFGSRRLDAMAFGFYFSLTYLVDRTIFDECAFSNPFQCRDLHVATWMHMTSRLNPTRGSQLVAKQWRRCALGDLGPGGHTTILARGHTSHFLGFKVNLQSFWCC